MILKSSSSKSRYPFVSWFSVVGGPTVRTCTSGFADTCDPGDSSNSSNTYCQVLLSRVRGQVTDSNDLQGRHQLRCSSLLEIHFSAIRVYQMGMRRPVSTGCVTLPMIDVLLSTRKGDRR